MEDQFAFLMAEDERVTKLGIETGQWKPYKRISEKITRYFAKSEKEIRDLHRQVFGEEIEVTMEQAILKES